MSEKVAAKREDLLKSKSSRKQRLTYQVRAHSFSTSVQFFVFSRIKIMVVYRKLIMKIRKGSRKVMEVSIEKISISRN